MAVIRQHADGSASWQSDDGAYSGRHGGPSTATSSAPKHRTGQWVEFAVSGAVTSACGIFTWRPEDQSRAHYVGPLVLDVTTAATGVATVDIGVSANVTTASDTLIDGLDVNSATGNFNTQKNAGTNGTGYRKLPAGSYVTGSCASGDTTGMVANVLIHYIPA